MSLQVFGSSYQDLNGQLAFKMTQFQQLNEDKLYALVQCFYVFFQTSLLY